MVISTSENATTECGLRAGNFKHTSKHVKSTFTDILGRVPEASVGTVQYIVKARRTATSEVLGPFPGVPTD